MNDKNAFIFGNSKFPYDCKEYPDLDDQKFIFLCDFCKTNNNKISINKNGLFKKLSDNNCNQYNTWALFAKETKYQNWICLQVGSSNNIKNEIKYAINSFEPYSDENTKLWYSHFHKDNSLFKAYYKMDIASQRYRSMFEHFNLFCFYAIKKAENLNEALRKFDINSVTEVQFALESSALYWNPNNSKKETQILGIIKNKNDPTRD